MFEDPLCELRHTHRSGGLGQHGSNSRSQGHIRRGALKVRSEERGVLAVVREGQKVSAEGWPRVGVVDDTGRQCLKYPLSDNGTKRLLNVLLAMPDGYESLSGIDEKLG